jgi:hypothetical protein
MGLVTLHTVVFFCRIFFLFASLYTQLDTQFVEFCEGRKKLNNRKLKWKTWRKVMANLNYIFFLLLIFFNLDCLFNFLLLKFDLKIYFSYTIKKLANTNVYTNKIFMSLKFDTAVNFSD